MKKRNARIIFTIIALLSMTSCSLKEASYVTETAKSTNLASDAVNENVSVEVVATECCKENTEFETLVSDALVTNAEELINLETTDDTVQLNENLNLANESQTYSEAEIVVAPTIANCIQEEVKSEVPTTKDDILTSVTEMPENESRVVLNVKNIQQLPELPAGCEVTATTIVMNYEGIDIDKMTLLKYLPKMQCPDENGRWDSPWKVFVGDPEVGRYGCYSPVIIDTVKEALAAKDITSYEVVDLSGSSIDELYLQIDNGHPVIVWATTFMKESYIGASWELQDGSNFNWRSKEHCLVLIGYDVKNNTVILSDPYDESGTVEYDADLFEKRYKELYEQALVIQKKA